MTKRIHCKKWSKKLNRRELGIVWAKIDAPYTYIDLNGNENYQGLSSKVVSLMTKYLGGKL